MRFSSFNQLPLYTDDFYFRADGNTSADDPIVIHNPQDALIVSPVFLRSRKTLDEHIRFIQEHQYRRAFLVGNDISYITQCPSLEAVKVYPSVDVQQFECSPLYELPNLQSLFCQTMADDDKNKIADVDYSRFRGLKTLYISGAKGHHHVSQAVSVQNLSCEMGYPNADTLAGAIPTQSLRSLSVCQSPIRSLAGIEEASALCRLSLSYNRRLTDISQLSRLQDSLRFLEIEACGKIRDFTVLSALHNLEFLILKGNNVLPKLEFLKTMPNLRYFHCTFDIADGDLHLCKNLPHASVQNRRHYSCKNEELPKAKLDPGKTYPFEIQ